MTNNELKKLSRSELIDILLEQDGMIEELKIQLEEANLALESKKMKIDKAGTLAEASLLISGVLEAAQSAADVYLENIRDTESACQKVRDEADAEAKKIVEEAEKSAEQTKADAKTAADNYWNEVSERLENFYDEHNGLRDLLKIGDRAQNII